MTRCRAVLNYRSVVRMNKLYTCSNTHTRGESAKGDDALMQLVVSQAFRVCCFLVFGKVNI